MKVLIICAGSRGDVQPYVALGKGLQAKGHMAMVNTCESFAPFIKENGLQYGYMNDDFMKFVDSEAAKSAMEGGGFFGLLKSMATMMQDAKRLLREMMRDAWQTAQDFQPDVIVYHPKAMAGPHIAEKMQIPAVLGLPVPVIVPTDEFPAVGFPPLRLGKKYNQMSYVVTHKGYHSYDDILNEFRVDVLGLEKLSKKASPIEMTDGSPITILHAHSAHVWPAPKDWASTTHVTGYWFLNAGTDWSPAPELEAFLAAGEAPVYVGFGSMAGRNPQKTAEMVIEALQKANKRGILATGWGGMDAMDVPDSVFVLKSAPHDWLFPQMAAVVHHGGAGTTGAGLRAGKPSVICPFMIDQPIWAKRVFELGVGSAPLPYKKLSAEKLAIVIEEVTQNEQIQENAKRLGEQIRGEDGVATAIAILEELMA